MGVPAQHVSYDENLQCLNSFGTGLYQGMDLRSIFAELNKGYENLKSDVPLNMLPPFTNVAKQIQV